MKKRGVFAIIINNQNQVLLSLRDDIPMWNLIGGGVEEEETFEQGLKREAIEEICSEIEIVRQTGHYHNKDSKGDDIEIKAYLCKIKKGKPKLGNEGICLQYFNLDNLPKNLVPKQKGRINDAMNSNILVIRTQNEQSTSECLNSLTKKDFTGWNEWVKNPKVLEKYKNKTLRFDLKKFK